MVPWARRTVNDSAPAGLARALALVRGDNWVSVDLIKEIFVPAVAHRMIMQDPATPAAGVLQEILDTVPVDGRRPAQRGCAGEPAAGAGERHGRLAGA